MTARKAAQLRRRDEWTIGRSPRSQEISATDSIVPNMALNAIRADASTGGVRLAACQIMFANPVGEGPHALQSCKRRRRLTGRNAGSWPVLSYFMYKLFSVADELDRDASSSRIGLSE